MHQDWNGDSSFGQGIPGPSFLAKKKNLQIILYRFVGPFWRQEYKPNMELKVMFHTLTQTILVRVLFMILIFKSNKILEIPCLEVQCISYKS